MKTLLENWKKFLEKQAVISERRDQTTTVRGDREKARRADQLKNAPHQMSPEEKAKAEQEKKDREKLSVMGKGGKGDYSRAGSPFVGPGKAGLKVAKKVISITKAAGKAAKKAKAAKAAKEATSQQRKAADYARREKGLGKDPVADELARRKPKAVPNRKPMSREEEQKAIATAMARKKAAERAAAAKAARDEGGKVVPIRPKKEALMRMIQEELEILVQEGFFPKRPAYRSEESGRPTPEETRRGTTRGTREDNPAKRAARRAAGHKIKDTPYPTKSEELQEKDTPYKEISQAEKEEEEKRAKQKGLVRNTPASEEEKKAVADRRTWSQARSMMEYALDEKVIPGTLASKTGIDTDLKIDPDLEKEIPTARKAAEETKEEPKARTINVPDVRPARTPSQEAAKTIKKVTDRVGKKGKAFVYKGTFEENINKIVQEELQKVLNEDIPAWLDPTAGARELGRKLRSGAVEDTLRAMTKGAPGMSHAGRSARRVGAQAQPAAEQEAAAEPAVEKPAEEKPEKKTKTTRKPKKLRKRRKRQSPRQRSRVFQNIVDGG